LGLGLSGNDYILLKTETTLAPIAYRPAGRKGIYAPFFSHMDFLNLISILADTHWEIQRGQYHQRVAD